MIKSKEDLTELILSSKQHLLITKKDDNSWIMTTIGLDEYEAACVIKALANQLDIEEDNIIILDNYRKKDIN